MSWYVRNLLKDAPVIRKSFEDGFYYDESDLNIPTYVDSTSMDDLLTVEMKINDLKKVGKISDKELKLIRLIQEGLTVKEISDLIGINKNKVWSDFRNLCERVAFHIGGKFTDEGTVAYMVNKYNLSSSAVDTLVEKLKEM